MAERTVVLDFLENIRKCVAREVTSQDEEVIPYDRDTYKLGTGILSMSLILPVRRIMWLRWTMERRLLLSSFGNGDVILAFMWNRVREEVFSEKGMGNSM